MKTKYNVAVWIAFMAITLSLVACGGSGMAAVAVEPAAGDIVVGSTTQVIVESDSRREASTSPEAQAEAPAREVIAATDTPVPVEAVIEPTLKPTAEPTATFEPVPTDTPIPTRIPTEEASVQYIIDPPKAVINFSCTSDGNISEQQVVLTDYETIVPLDTCSNVNVEVVELSGEMTLAGFAITWGSGGTTGVNRYLHRMTTSLPEGSTVMAQRSSELTSGGQYYSGATLTFSCEDGFTSWMYVFAPGAVQIPEFPCTGSYWGKIETWEGMFTFTHPSGEVVTIPTWSKNTHYTFDTPLAEWSVEYSIVPLGQ